MLQIEVRDQFKKDIREVVIENREDLLTFLKTKQQELYCIIKSDSITNIDIDRHELPPLTEEECNRLIANLPDSLKPDIYFPSHNGGLKLLYIGNERAKLAYLVVLLIRSQYSSIEIKNDFRHPLAKHSETDGQCSGIYTCKHTNSPVRLEDLSIYDLEDETDSILTKYNLVKGERYDHSKCPINPSTKNNGSVNVLEKGIYCHTCVANGDYWENTTTPGWVPFKSTRVLSLLKSLIKNQIHWCHAEHVLRSQYPLIAPKILKEAYKQLIISKFNKVSDLPFAFIDDFFSEELSLIFHEGGTVVCKDTREIYKDLKGIAPHLPYCRKYFVNDKGKWVYKTNKKRVSNLISGVLKHDVPKIKFFKGLNFESSDSLDIFYCKNDQKNIWPVTLLKTPLTIEDAFQKLRCAFPGIDENALQLVIAAVICSAAKKSPPNILFITGPSGSGKGETVNIGASMLEQIAPKISFDSDYPTFFRALGTNLLSGNNTVCIDEIGKIGYKKVNEFMTKILQLSSTITYRPLHCNNDISVDTKLALFCPTTTIPESLYNSPEFKRRVWHYKLFTKVKDWKISCGGDSANWRNISKENLQVANSIVTHVYNMAVSNNFNFDLMAESLGANRLDNEQDDKHVDIVEFFKFSCGLSSKKPEKIINSSFKKEGQWLKLNSDCAREYIGQLISNPDDDDKLYIWHGVKRDLISLDITSALLNSKIIDSTQKIELEVDVKGKSVGYRFKQITGHLRGQWFLNENIPNHFKANGVVKTLTAGLETYKELLNNTFNGLNKNE